LERTNKSIALLNGIGVVVLLVYSVAWLGSLCLLCSAYYVASLISLWLFWRYGVDGSQGSFLGRFGRPSLKHLAVAAVATGFGAYGFAAFHAAKEDAQSGAVAVRVVDQYFNLPIVPLPSIVSPYWIAKSTEKFEDAPIQVILYSDLLCPDCRYLAQQLDRLRAEFEGKTNIAFQFFPLDAQCNHVVDKDKHPGACDLSYISAYDPEKFIAIHDEIFANMRAAKDPAWRDLLIKRHGVEGAREDVETRELVDRIIQTGTEYEKNHEQYQHGIRSTPTMIINNRMVIGTLAYEQLRAIFTALIDERQGPDKFLENWVDE
jgi:protein-disulfide isomerase